MARNYKTLSLIVPPAEYREFDPDGRLMNFEVHKITGSIDYYPGQLISRTEVEALIEMVDTYGDGEDATDFHVWTVNLVG